MDHSEVCIESSVKIHLSPSPGETGGGDIPLNLHEGQRDDLPDEAVRDHRLLRGGD